MKTKFTLIIILCWLTVLNGFCQDVICEGDVFLKSQAEVNAFNCTEITGELFISGPDITDLSPLQNLKKVGALHIWENANLTNVDGLSGLVKITKISGMPYAIGIRTNPSLKNLDGLANVTDSLGPISISDNPSLESINAFSYVKTAFALFTISNNASLKSIDGFQNLTSVRNYGFEPFVLIDNNPSLISINGFSSLKEISGNGAGLQISNNAALTSIDGFSSLISISGGGRGAGLFIENNASLTNIDGFSSLSILGYGVAGVITVNNNVKLANVDGLSSVKISQGNFRLTVTNNTSLTNCQGLFPMMASFGLLDVSAENFRISGNGSGCTLEDIIANGIPAVGGFATYNKVTGQLNSLYQNTANYSLADPNFRNYILQANTPSSVKSVEFKINGNSTFLDNTAPFQLDIQSLVPGSYTVVAEPYSEPNKKGQKGTPSTAYVKIAVEAWLSTFEVVHTSGSFIKYLLPETRINLKDPAFKSFNIRSTANPTIVNNIKFWLNGVLVATESVYPYLLAGDAGNGTYYPWKPKPGRYNLRAVPYIVHNNKEYAGTPTEVVFYIDDTPTTQIVNFDVVDTSGKILKQLNEGDKINIGDPTYKQFTIVANTTGKVGSVKFKLDQNFITENVVPYSITGDNNGYYNPWKPSLGNHSLSATPYASANGQGEAGKNLTINFTVVNEPPFAIARFDIVNTSGKILKQLQEGDKINLNDPAYKTFTIVATVTGKAGSVKFKLDQNFVTENVIPYSVTGDNNGYYNPWNASLGNHTISAIPYANAGAQGIAGKELKVNFTIIKDNAVAKANVSNGDDLKVTLYPVPVKETLFVQITNGNTDYLVALKNSQGYIIHKGTYSAQQSQTYNIATSELQSGVYFLQVKGANGFEKVIRIMK